MYAVLDLNAPDWIEEALPLNGTRDWRPAPLGRGVTYLRGVFVRVTRVERTLGRCRNGDKPASQGYECLKMTLHLVTDPDPYPREVDISGVDFLVDGEKIDDWSRTSYSFDGTEDDAAPIVGRLATFLIEVESGWKQAVLVYYPLYHEPIAFLALTETETDFRGSSAMLSGEAFDRYEAAATTENPGLLERLVEIGVDWAEEPPSDNFMVEPGASPLSLALTCAEYVALPASTPASAVLAMAAEVSETAVGEALPGFFADLDDAPTFCGTAFPESSKPVVLLMMAAVTQGLCLFGDAGAFGADISDAMLAGEKFINYWGAEAPIAISDFEDGDEVCRWFFDEENAVLMDLLANVDPRMLGGPETVMP